MDTQTNIIILLGFLVVFQQVFFLYQMHKFTDKVMSGTYTAYVQTQALSKPTEPMSGFSVQMPQDEGPSELDLLNMQLKPPF